MKVSIIGYKKGEDLLLFDNVGKLSYDWNENSGVLEVSGEGDASDYEEAITKVYYENISSSKQAGLKEFSISLLDADYLPYTKHFYQYYDQGGISWSNARAQAAGKNYYGLQGYLATIRSLEEQNFILSKTKGTGWIGGSDAEKEGTWKWVEGPIKVLFFGKACLVENLLMASILIGEVMSQITREEKITLIYSLM